MRLFVAVWLPDEGIEVLRRLRRPEVDGVRWTPVAQWHVTLRFLGEVADDHVAAAVDALAGVAVPAVAMPAVGAVDVADAADAGIEAVLGPASELLSPRVLSVPVAGLDAVAGAVATAFAAVGETQEERSFRGHITLARLKGLHRRDAQRLAGEPITYRWPVEEIALVRSHLGGGPSHSPARYETLATRSLTS